MPKLNWPWQSNLHSRASYLFTCWLLTVTHGSPWANKVLISCHRSVDVETLYYSENLKDFSLFANNKLVLGTHLCVRSNRKQNIWKITFLLYLLSITLLACQTISVLLGVSKEGAPPVLFIPSLCYRMFSMFSLVADWTVWRTWGQMLMQKICIVTAAGQCSFVSKSPLCITKERQREFWCF